MSEPIVYIDRSTVEPEMEAIEVYGEPTNRMLGQLEAKARDLGERGRVSVDTLHAGFTRIGPQA